MAFTLNKNITTNLHFEEVCAISVACFMYQELYSKEADPEILKTMRHLSDRLMRELYNHPDNDKPNGH